MQIHNCTPFTEEEIVAFSVLGHTRNSWRQRMIDLYAHPTDIDQLVSVGTTFDGTMRVIAVEPRSSFATALDYASRRKVYVSD